MPSRTDPYLFAPHNTHNPDKVTSLASAKEVTTSSQRPSVSPYQMEYGEAVVDHLLKIYGDPLCPKCRLPMKKRITNRPMAIRCDRCKHMGSRFKDTPFANLKIPYGIMGLIIEESAVMHPQVLTASAIHRKYGVAYNTSSLLKRRIQVLASDVRGSVGDLIRRELNYRFKGITLPRHENADLTEHREKHGIPQADTLVLYSASQRANKGRSRYRHSGQTASIYKSDRLGGEQVGTLTHILSWKKGPIAIDSIPDLRMENVSPILEGLLPPHTPLFTDEGYKFYYRKNRNHRMVNHSARSKSSRNKWARNRFCKNGVHNQVAEGNGRALKQAFSAYGWISPKYSQLYLNEYSLFRNLRYFGLDAIAEAHRSRTSANSGTTGPAGLTSPAQTRNTSISSGNVLTKGYVNPCEHNLSAIDGAEAERTFDSGEHILCVHTKEQICPSNSRIKRLSWLRTRIKDLEYNAPTLADRNRSATRQSNQYDLLLTLQEQKWESLRNEITRYAEFSKSKTAPKHRRAKERFYSGLAERLWNSATLRGATEHFVSVDDLVRIERLPQRSLYRVLKRWEALGVIALRDVPHPVHRGHHFHLSMNIEKQPFILFAQTKETT